MKQNMNDFKQVSPLPSISKINEYSDPENPIVFIREGDPPTRNVSR